MSLLSKKQILVYSLFCCIFITIVFGMYVFLFKMKKNIQIKVDTILTETVTADMWTRLKKWGQPYAILYGNKDKKRSGLVQIRTVEETEYYSKSLTDSIRSLHGGQRKHAVFQTILALEKPINVYRLDELFQTSLQKAGLKAKTAIYYTSPDTTVCSTTDSTFYKSARPLNKVYAGLKREIELQAYVKIPILTQMKTTSKDFVLVFFLLILFVSAFFWIKYSSFAEKYIYNPAKKTLRPLMMLTPEIGFDSERGYIIGKGKEVKLINYKLRLFRLFLDSPGYYLGLAEILRSVWDGAIVSSNTIEQTIRRLRNDLKCFPEIRIVTERKVGYRLVIGNDDDLGLVDPATLPTAIEGENAAKEEGPKESGRTR